MSHAGSRRRCVVVSCMLHRHIRHIVDCWQMADTDTDHWARDSSDSSRQCPQRDSHSLSHSYSASYSSSTRCFRKSIPPKTFWNIFTAVKSFCVKFCKFVGNSYPHISTNFRRFILKFHQMALIFPRVPIIFTLSSFAHSPRKWKTEEKMYRQMEGVWCIMCPPRDGLHKHARKWHELCGFA